mmetsp:Transcript_22756/g.57887  ORF Transcript_22756/g.57887 Transcript_22756/m.57887 type:complete len:201 (-) Transcript_22756:581-1183(-)
MIFRSSAHDVAFWQVARSTAVAAGSVRSSGLGWATGGTIADKLRTTGHGAVAAAARCSATTAASVGEIARLRPPPKEPPSCVIVAITVLLLLPTQLSPSSCIGPNNEPTFCRLPRALFAIDRDESSQSSPENRASTPRYTGTGRPKSVSAVLRRVSLLRFSRSSSNVVRSCSVIAWQPSTETLPLNCTALAQMRSRSARS